MVKNKYNVVLIGASFFDGMAGSMRVRNLLEPLVEKDLISLSNLIYEKDNKEPIGKKGIIQHVTFKIIGFRMINIFSVFGFIFGGMSFLRKNKKKHLKNILYNFGSPDVKNILFILYARLIGYKVILDVMEDMNFEGHAGFIHKIRIKTSVFLFKHSRYFVDSIITISEHLMKLSRSAVGNKIPVSFVPIAVNLKNFEPAPVVTQKDNLKIFYGGSFGKKDGLNYLISAFDKLNSVHTATELIFTGSAHKADMDRIVAQIDTAANKNKIVYKGFLSNSDYYAVLNDCDIFCMTRVNSKFSNAGFPSKLVEFLAAGKAIIATRVGDVPLYLENDVNALVISPESVDELAAALTMLVENVEKRRTLGIAARKTAEQYFESNSVSMMLISVLESV